MREWDEYTRDVLKQKRPTGEFEFYCVKHALKLRKKYDFDEDAAEYMINKVHLFRHTKGKWEGKPFNLLPFQFFLIAYIFGLKKPDGLRLIREAMLNMSKKGGKSEFDGALAVLFTFFDKERTAECYTAANKTEQAMYSWTAALMICKRLAAEYDDFREVFKYQDTLAGHVITNKASNNFFKTLPYQNKTLDGVNPHLAIIDEYHEYPDDKLPSNLRSGMVLREQPLLFYSTTRGYHPYGPLAEREEYYWNVITEKWDDDTILPLIFSMDEGDDWLDQNNWIKSNPGMAHGLPSAEVLEIEQSKAIKKGGAELVSCRTKNFNIWERSSNPFVDFDAWNKGRDPIDEYKLRGRECFMAFDIGRTDDLSCLGTLFPPQGNEKKFIFTMKLYMPEDVVTRRSDQHKVPYRQWINNDYIKMSPGNYTDTSVIETDVYTALEEYDVQKIGADKAFALELINKLAVKGAPVIEYPQTFATMNAPILFIQKIVNQGLLHHGNIPPLNWMLSNVDLRRDSGGRVMFDKSDRITGQGRQAVRTKKKIDAMVVMAMCFGLYLNWIKDNPKSKYETGSVRVLGRK